ncbi:hypothetical protein CCP2SC5_550016 [Azospirillaceae bacterium]
MSPLGVCLLFPISEDRVRQNGVAVKTKNHFSGMFFRYCNSVDCIFGLLRKKDWEGDVFYIWFSWNGLSNFYEESFAIPMRLAVYFACGLQRKSLEFVSIGPRFL